jgi:hypothetical protein
VWAIVLFAYVRLHRGGDLCNFAVHKIWAFSYWTLDGVVAGVKVDSLVKSASRANGSRWWRTERQVLNSTLCSVLSKPLATRYTSHLGPGVGTRPL